MRSHEASRKDSFLLRSREGASPMQLQRASISTADLDAELPRPGSILAGKYRVERVLGRGGMATIAEAHHLQLDRRVALKYLDFEALENPELIERFMREARAAARISSQHV